MFELMRNLIYDVPQTQSNHDVIINGGLNSNNNSAIFLCFLTFSLPLLTIKTYKTPIHPPFASQLPIQFCSYYAKRNKKKQNKIINWEMVGHYGAGRQASKHTQECPNFTYSIFNCKKAAAFLKQTH